MSGVGSVAMSAGVVSYAKSEVTIPDEVNEGDLLYIAIKLKDESGKPVAAKEEVSDSVKVEMKALSGGDAIAWDLNPIQSSYDSLVGTFKTDKKQGKVRVTAKTGTHDFKGSPATVNIVDPMSTKFDPGLCHKYLSISDHSYNRTVVHVRERGMQKGEPSCASVYGTMKLTEGKHEIAIQIDQLGSLDGWPGSHNCVVGFANKERLGLEAERSDFAWISDGSGLGQPWKAGDVIILSLDFDSHTLVGQHWRNEVTGGPVEKEGFKGDLWLYISSYAEGDEFTIFNL
eukprot:scpid80296/ scgid26236/ 